MNEWPIDTSAVPRGSQRRGIAVGSCLSPVAPFRLSVLARSARDVPSATSVARTTTSRVIKCHHPARQDTFLEICDGSRDRGDDGHVASRPCESSWRCLVRGVPRVHPRLAVSLIDTLS